MGTGCAVTAITIILHLGLFATGVKLRKKPVLSLLPLPRFAISRAWKFVIDVLVAMIDCVVTVFWICHPEGLEICDSFNA